MPFCRTIAGRSSSPTSVWLNQVTGPRAMDTNAVILLRTNLQLIAAILAATAASGGCGDPAKPPAHATPVPLVVEGIDERLSEEAGKTAEVKRDLVLAEIGALAFPIGLANTMPAMDWA